MRSLKLSGDGTARGSVFTNGAASSAREYGSKKRPKKFLRKERVHGKALDWPKNVRKTHNRQQQSYYRIAVAPQPVQVALGPRFSHEQHDARAAIERGNGKQIKRSEQEIEEEENPKDARSEIRATSVFVDMEPVVSPAQPQDHRSDDHQRIVCLGTRECHPRGSPGMPPLPLGIVRSAPPAQQTARYDQREDWENYHAPR